MTYTPLFIHTEYSLLSSTIRINALVDFAAEQGFNALGITDNHNLFGAVEFSVACHKKKIQPIIGTRMQLEGNREILVYAKDLVGYQNISYLLTNSYLKTNTNTHEVTWEKLFKKSEGIIIIAVPSILAAQNLEDLKTCGEHLNHSKAEWYVGLEPDEFFLHETSYISKVFNKPVVAVSETRFLLPVNYEAHDTLLCIKNKNYISEHERVKADMRFAFLSMDQAKIKFANQPFALENSNRLAKKCTFSLKPASPKLPRFRSQNNETEKDVLTKTALEGLKSMKVLAGDFPVYLERLNYELSIINKMEFAGYFLIVSDFIKFARNAGIPVSIRGSGAGSLVARCINITEIDPIKFELFFERFLNPDRISMPDFDIDFSPNGREIVIDYVSNKYGAQCVAGIITFGSLASRAVLKDVGRVLHVPYSKVDQLSKRIQVVFGRPFTLDETYERDKEFASLIDEDETLTRVFLIARQLEGLSRHVSAHAAGIIISDSPIYLSAPLYKDPGSSIPLIQFSMKYAELIGLIKFDFLGVTALDVLAQTIAEAAKYNLKINLEDIELNDESTFAFLRDGHTRGVFQFETPGMTQLIADMDANCIEDLIATVSLYRPGPMDNIPTFIKYKKGIENVHYIYPDLEPILRNTYGIIVYQEQILKIVQVIAGYSLAEADLFRRAIGKKNIAEMERYRIDFIERTHRKQGGDRMNAESLFKLIETFANYGFNKAHAVAYALVGYRGAYLKKHYMIYFMCASMTAEQNNPPKLAELIHEARVLNMPIERPCINRSQGTFMIDGETILYSLRGIRNIGQHVVDTLVNNRPFVSITDLFNKTKLNKREIESLIKSGSLDCFGLNRGILLQTWLLLSSGETLFDAELFVPESSSWTRLEGLVYQKEVLDLYLDCNPVDLYPIKQLSLKTINDYPQNQDIIINNIACTLERYEVKVSKSNKRFYICYFSDSNSQWEGMLMPEIFSDSLDKLQNKVLVCNIKVSNNRKIINHIMSINDRINQIESVYIKITNPDQLYKLDKIIAPFKSIEGVAVYISADEVVHIGFIQNFSRLMENLTEYEWRAR